MDGFTRYAVFHAPAAGPLADFGGAWLGWDPLAGRRCAHPALPGLPRPAAALTEGARRSGFHATLKPPFRLADGLDVADLHRAIEAVAAGLPPVMLDALHLAQLDGFLALVPTGPATDVAMLAARLVDSLDMFRAPLDEAELAARRALGLTPLQDELLRTWGHPFVMEEFRFHMTLTDRLSKAETSAVASVLRPAVEPLAPSPFRLRDICLFGEGQDGMFRNLHRYTLSG
jgi:hypothetical protein